MARVTTMRNIMMELRKTCQGAFVSAPELEDPELTGEAAQKALVESSGKLAFLKLLLPKLKERGHRILLFSQFKIGLDRIQDFLYNEGYNFLRLDGDVAQAVRQKQMDAFNAPDSDIFIFMLTTRAGGVGINLASADTVIIFDPDFNPHQDHQAIARAHRYGQTKPVLVFRLMMKNSIEEKIILNGKKKMVLDHLVVQQLGKENEEGDIDNMLLHGAAALYNTNADGTAETDIKYSSKDVEELIDKVEADAVAEAKALEEKERHKGSASQMEYQDGKKKESMSFAFAKIWEADANRVHEMSDDEDDDEAAQAEEWQAVLRSVEASRQKAMLADLVKSREERRQAAAQAVQNAAARMPTGGYGSEGSAKAKARRGKKRKSGEGSDGDYALDPDHESESESDGEHGVVDDSDLALLQRQQNKGSVPMPRERGRPPKAAKFPGSSNNNIAIPAVPSIAGQHPPPHPPHPSSHSLPRDNSQHATTSIERAQRNTRLASLGPAKIEEAQQICQWLYHVLNNLNRRGDLETWAWMALPEMHPDERVAHYYQLAKVVDEEMMRRGQVQYFTTSIISRTVLPLLQNGGAVLPTDWQNQPYPRQTELGARKWGAYNARPLSESRAAPANAADSSTKAIANSPHRPSTSTTKSCEFCHDKSHTLGACDKLPDMARLKVVRERVVAALATGTGEHKDFKLEDIDRLIGLSRKQAALRSSHAPGPSNVNITPPAAIARPAAARQTPPAQVIYVDDDGETDVQERPAMKRRPIDSAKKIYGPCAICGAKMPHPPASCPIVTSGPDSIKEALKIHAPSSPTWATLKKLYDETVPASIDIGTAAHLCPFCGEACGRTVRQCATATGGSDAAGRKLLKGRIRAADGQDDPTMDALFDVYLKWEK